MRRWPEIVRAFRHRESDHGMVSIDNGQPVMFAPYEDMPLMQPATDAGQPPPSAPGGPVPPLTINVHIGGPAASGREMARQLAAELGRAIRHHGGWPA